MEEPENQSKGPGRPTKFDIAIRDKIMMLTSRGKTDKEIAAEIGVAESTFHLWKIKLDPQYSESLTAAKDMVDSEVETALLKNAINNNNVTAQIFWLKNRRSTDWRDKVELAVEEITDMDFGD